MIKTIENENLIVSINETGAELYSIKSKKTGIEYLWQGDPTYWKGHAPVLFPICGRLVQGKYTYKGKDYAMQIHGIARTSELQSVKASEREIDFIFRSDENTRISYPFDFVFTVKYALADNILKITYSVENTGKDLMPFAFGAHPAFNVPFNAGENFEDYYLEFTRDAFDKRIMSDSCFYLGKTEKFPLKNNILPLRHDLFDNDALFFETETDKISLKSAKSDNFVEISYEDMTCFGLWHVPKTDAPYLCIEPWHGFPSDEGKVDDLETKREMLKLKSGEIYKNTHEIKISEK